MKALRLRRSESEGVQRSTRALRDGACASLGIGGIRGSDLADHQVVIAATLRLAYDPVTAGREGEAALAEIVRWRREHQPGGQNAGSVFVNPRPGELAAAQLIDGCGLRGRRVGGAQVSFVLLQNFVQNLHDYLATHSRRPSRPST